MRPTTRPTGTALTLTVAAAIVLTACGADPGSDVAPEETTATEAPTPEPDDAETSPSPQTTADETSPPQEQGEDDAELTDFAAEEQASENWDDFTLDVSHDTMQVLSDVRHAVHDGYERVVLEYSETTDLAYRAHYGDESETSPAPLMIEIQGTTGGPEAEELAVAGPWSIDAPEGLIREVHLHVPEAGESHVDIELDQVRPFRIHHAEEPLRIVIDITSD